MEKKTKIIGLGMTEKKKKKEKNSSWGDGKKDKKN